VKVEHLPWAPGQRRLTKAYAWFLATWAKRVSWTQVAQTFHTSWENVFRSVAMAVHWGRMPMALDDLKAIGIDVILWHKGHQYLTVVYQIDEHRKRHVAALPEGRRQESLPERACPGPVPHHVDDEQGYRQSPARRSKTAPPSVAMSQCSRARDGCYSSGRTTSRIPRT